jgi:hypothetical protein
MQSTHSRQPRLIAAALPILLGLALAACSSNSSTTNPTSAPPTSNPGSPASSSPATTGNEPTSGAGAIAAIKANWATFFNAKTPNSRRVQLLQDGQLFAAVLKAQSSNPLASSASAKVSKVSLTSASQAAVTYTILVSGAPVLSGQKGVAVYQSGVWKVGFASFCGLLILQNAGKTSGLPAVCKG